MMGKPSDVDDLDGKQKTLEEIAKEISEFRQEYLKSIVEAVVDESHKINEEFDPAAGRGRGPWWAG